MAKTIVTKIKPLYDDLIKIRFNEFVGTNDFVRICNSLGLTEIYTSAYNESLQEKDTFDLTNFGDKENADLLAKFINKLFADEGTFSNNLAIILSEFLVITAYPVYAENILQDLKELGLSDVAHSKLSNDFSAAQGNYLKKARYLKQIMMSRATGGGGDEELYYKLRSDFVKSTSLKNYIPDFFSQCETLEDFWQFIKSNVSQYQPRRDFLNKAFAPLITFLEQDNIGTSIVEITTIDNIYIQDAWKKALDRMIQDPEGAITSSRTLMETVCKHILDGFNEQYDDIADLPKLYKMTANLLQLSPDQNTEQIFKQILGGCQSIVVGLGSMRNKLSDAHGKGSKAVKPSARHAGLAVNLSGAMCQFLLQTFEERNAKQKQTSN